MVKTKCCTAALRREITGTSAALVLPGFRSAAELRTARRETLIHRLRPASYTRSPALLSPHNHEGLGR